MKLDKRVNDLMSDVYSTLKEVDVLLLTNDEYENDNDSVWELPRVSRVTKHGHYQEFCITKITKGGDITAKGIGEDWGDDLATTVDELNYEEAIVLLGYLNS